jgi:methylmalonyl-CoA/ethylmalonyl-CoA epimerase
MTPTEQLLFSPAPGKVGSPLAYLGRGYFQVAYVTPDMDRLLATLNDDLGVGPFFVIRDAHVEDQTYRGKPLESQQHLAFGYAGELQFEVIQPVAGESIYTEFLDSLPRGGLHHLGILVDDYDTAVSEVSQRLELVQTGRSDTTRFAYFNTVETLGSWTEIVQLGERDLGLFAKIRAQEL